jgi:hypothetical protein
MKDRFDLWSDENGKIRAQDIRKVLCQFYLAIVSLNSS